MRFVVVVMLASWLCACAATAPRPWGYDSWSTHPAQEAVRLQPLVSGEERCDLGLLRGTPGMRCADELKRLPVWGLW